MKLEQIQEAKYSGEHPLMVKINNAMNNGQRATFKFTSSVKEAIEMITNELGEPAYYPVHYGSNEQYSWTVGSMIVALTLRERHATIHILNTSR